MLNKFWDKINNDYKWYIIENIAKRSKEELLENAEDLYHAQNFYWHMDYMLQNTEDIADLPITPKTFSYMLTYDGNIVDFYMKNRCEFRHFERYNYEDYEDFCEILNIIMGSY